MDIHPAIMSFLSFFTPSFPYRKMSTPLRIRVEFGRHLTDQEVELIEEIAKAYAPTTPIEQVLRLPDFKNLLFTQFPEFDPDIA